MVNFTNKLPHMPGIYFRTTHSQSLFPDRFANQIDLIDYLEQDEFEKPIMTSKDIHSWTTRTNYTLILRPRIRLSRLDTFMTSWRALPLKG